MAAVPAPAKAARALAACAAGMVLLWCVHFRGGLALGSPTNKGLIFNVHPVFMLIGFIILGSEAIMSYKILPWGHDTNKMIHLLLHAVALLLGSIGIYAAFKFHNESGIANLYSLHSWVGLGTICLYGLQWIFGFVTFFFPGASPTLRRTALPWHVRAGLFVYILSLLAAELGFLEKLTFLQAGGLGKYSSEALVVNFTALLVILLGSTVVLYVTAPVHGEHSHGYSAVHKS
uniref:Cytochrome b561 domain-containing protein n=1 Tax=Leersia perrieri TaxID=77586 RepID=A0A0D9XL98_9ORYZ